MKTIRFFVLFALVFPLVACGLQETSPIPTSTVTLTPTHTITFTPTQISTDTPFPTATPTITPTSLPTKTSTQTVTFTPPPMLTPQADRYFRLTIINRSGQPLSLQLESVDQPGTGYEFTITIGETKVFTITAATYTVTMWHCGNKTTQTLQMTTNVRLTFVPCK